MDKERIFRNNECQQAYEKLRNICERKGINLYEIMFPKEKVDE